MEKEVWKDVVGSEGYYQVSNKGNVRSLDRMIEYKNGYSRLHNGVTLKHLHCKEGYLKVNIWKDNEFTKPLVHTLVAKAFLGVPEDSTLMVNHKDGNKQNNLVENLEWVTSSENCVHAMKSGLRKSNKLNEEKVREIRELAKQGMTRVAIAKIYNVSSVLVCYVLNGKAWSHVT